MMTARTIAVAAIFLAAMAAARCGCAADRILNFQGRLTTADGTPITVPITVTFTLWDAPDNGNQLGLGGTYSDEDLVTPDAHGIFYTFIGDDPGNKVPPEIFVTDSVWVDLAYPSSPALPRTRLAASGYAINAMSRSGENYRTVPVTNNAVTNGSHLIAGYQRAKALTPNGAARSETNRVTLLVPPGHYNLGAMQLVLDAEFVDVVGVSTSRADQLVYGTSGGPNTGVIRQTGNNIHLENLTVDCTLPEFVGPTNSTDPAAYFPDAGTTATVIRNCSFKTSNSPEDNSPYSMRLGIAYPGTFVDCEGEDLAFGARPGGNASGQFLRCVGGIGSFGGSGGTASGFFWQCTGADASFAGHGIEGNVASGVFEFCRGGDLSFGAGGTASGRFTSCVGGSRAFGGVSAAPTATASGVFVNCVGEYGAFGGDGGVASGSFSHCTGGAHSFGGSSGVASGTFSYCVGDDLAFGGGSLGSAGGGKFFYCMTRTAGFTTSGVPAPVHRYCLNAGVVYP